MDTNSDLSNKPSVEELVEKYANGEIKAYEIEKHVNPNKAAEIRLKGLEKKYNKRFDNLKVYSILPQNCGPNIENMIGAIQVPLGIAGPVKIKGEYSIGEFHIPLSTTEGTLVASVNRGCSVINKSGGAKVVILKSGQTRSVLFKAKSVIESNKFVDWVKENIGLLKKEAKAERQKKYQWVFMNGKQVRIKRPTTIDGMSIDEYIQNNADPIWLHQNELWEYMDENKDKNC